MPAVLGCDTGDLSDHFANLCKNFIRHPVQEDSIAHPPIQAAHMLAKHCALNGQSRRKQYLKPISFNFTGDWAGICNRGSYVEVSGGEHNRRSPSGLLMTSLRIEIQPDQIAGIRHVGGYQTSAPRGLPQSYSPRLPPSSNPSINSSSVHRFAEIVGGCPEDLTKAIPPLPLRTHSTGSPTGSAASAANSSGISTVRVFPTRTIRVVMDQLLRKS